jgi:hypothetical protein
MTDLTWLIPSYGILLIIILIGIFVVLRLVKERRSGFPAGDERTQKIMGKAATVALYIGMYFTLALLAANLIGNELYGTYGSFFPEAGYALIASLLVYSVSFIILRWYFGRKADS